MIKKEWHFMQTPKEKAYEIYKKFYNLDGQDLYYTMTSKEAKQCAKVHITLILESEILKPSNNQTIEYYQEVLTQINKL